ncbi:MAG: class I SAM-dependent DNA methyltransferase [Evtepia gabavorous]
MRGSGDTDTPIKKAIVKSAFEDANNYMKDGVYLRQVIDVIDEIAFDDVKESHAFGFVYEEILRELQSAGSSGEFYTPRAVTEFMALMIKPQLGERWQTSPAAPVDLSLRGWGSSGQVTDTTAQKQLDDSIYGVEKPFPYLLCVTNMLLHDIEVPNIYHMNSLKHNLLDYTDEDKFDVILMNPPYGGHEDKSIQGFFLTIWQAPRPQTFCQSSCTALKKKAGLLLSCRTVSCSVWTTPR